jgi:hypothetical protein
MSLPIGETKLETPILASNRDTLEIIGYGTGRF